MIEHHHEVIGRDFISIYSTFFFSLSFFICFTPPDSFGVLAFVFVILKVFLADDYNVLPELCPHISSVCFLLLCQIFEWVWILKVPRSDILFSIESWRSVRFLSAP